MRAVCRIRAELTYRRAAFVGGLEANGLQVVDAVATPAPGDVLVIWNRYGANHTEARRFEAAGAAVIVAENGYLGRDWRGSEWFALALGHHNGAGSWPKGGPERWDSWNVPLAPMREDGTEVVLLPQRGIGEPGVAMPSSWLREARKHTGPKARVRLHPGESGKAVPLEQDLARARCVATWASGAALKALLLGIPVFYSFPQWIGAKGARRLGEVPLSEPQRDPAARLTMLRELAHAMYSIEEVQDGSAFRALLGL